MFYLIVIAVLIPVVIIVAAILVANWATRMLEAWTERIFSSKVSPGTIQSIKVATWAAFFIICLMGCYYLLSLVAPEGFA